MATTVRSRKSKGYRLQKYIVEKIRSTFGLGARDVVSVPGGVPGADVMLSEKASEVFPYSVECKNQEKLNIWAALEQCEGENRDLTPLLVFKRNRSEVYCALKLDDFLNIIGKQNETK